MSALLAVGIFALACASPPFARADERVGKVVIKKLRVFAFEAGFVQRDRVTEVCQGVPNPYDVVTSAFPDIHATWNKRRKMYFDGGDVANVSPRWPLDDSDFSGSSFVTIENGSPCYSSGPCQERIVAPPSNPAVFFQRWGSPRRVELSIENLGLSFTSTCGNLGDGQAALEKLLKRELATVTIRPTPNDRIKNYEDKTLLRKDEQVTKAYDCGPSCDGVASFSRVSVVASGRW